MLEKVEHLMKNKDYQQAESVLSKCTKENSLSVPVLLARLRLEEKQGKSGQALKTSNLILFIQPDNLVVHQTKLKLLRDLQQFNQLSDCLVATLTLQPNIQFSQL